jgi:hypothetical protein
MIPFGANSRGTKRAQARLPIGNDAEYTGWESVPHGGELRGRSVDGNRSARRAESAG